MKSLNIIHQILNKNNKYNNNYKILKNNLKIIRCENK